MRRRRALQLALGALASPAFAQRPAREAPPLARDFDALWEAIDRNYAYFGPHRAEWRRARDAFRPAALRARSPAELLPALEGLVARLRDDHVTLSARSPAAPRRVPDEADLWARWRDGAAVVEAVRTFSDADVAGVKPGHAITHIGGLATERAVRRKLAGGRADAASRDWALRQLLAGPQSGALELTVREGRASRTLAVEHARRQESHGPPLIGRRMGEGRDLGYIRVKAALDEARVAGLVDGALDYLARTRALILDLRETHGDAGHGVTRAVLGRFAAGEAAWQVREARDGARAIDRVAARKARYEAPVLVLVDRWTAAEGEALAAGMKAVARARLVGTPMAGLRGELAAVRLPASGIVARYPAERVLLPGGTPREELQPDVAVDLAAPLGGPGDPILYQALKLLEPSPARGGRSAPG